MKKSIMFLFLILLLAPLGAFEKDGQVNNFDLELMYAGMGFDELIMGSAIGYEAILPEGIGLRGMFFMGYAPLSPLYLDLGASMVLSRQDEIKDYMSLIEIIQGGYYDTYVWEKGKTMTTSMHLLDFGVRPFLMKYETYDADVTFGDIQTYLGWRYLSAYSEVGLTGGPFEFYARGLLGFANGRVNTGIAEPEGPIPGLELGLKWMTFATKVIIYQETVLFYITIGLRYSF
jgi:hypothetical protein